MAQDWQLDQLYTMNALLCRVIVYSAFIVCLDFDNNECTYIVYSELIKSPIHNECTQ